MGKVEIVKPEAIIDVKIGSAFLKELQTVTVYLSSLKSTDDLKKIVDKVNNKEELNEWEQVMYTMLVLVTTIEENARKEGLTTIEEVPEGNQPLV